MKYKNKLEYKNKFKEIKDNMDNFNLINLFKIIWLINLQTENLVYEP